MATIVHERSRSALHAGREERPPLTVDELLDKVDPVASLAGDWDSR